MLFFVTTQKLVFDPLEQFESGYLFDSYYYKYFLVFFFCSVFFVIIEKSLNLFISDSFIGSLMSTLVKTNLPKKFYYVYYILYPTFLLLFSANIAGLFAYGYTETAAVPLVFLFSFMIFFGILFTGLDKKRNFILNSFLPSGTPNAILKLIIFIEVVSYCTRLISLGLRLLANMISGHILLKILISFVWILVVSQNFFTVLFFLPWSIVLVVLCLEILIAFLQSYVFVFLSIVFIKELV